MKLRGVFGLACLVGGVLPAAAPAAPATSAPKLAVLVSVDGLSAARLVQYRPWYVAGLKRLFDEGYVEREARYRHMNTETGPGHASLGTGAPPRVHGIVANRWFEERPDRSLRSVYCTDQPDPRAPPGSEAVVPGPANLRVGTLGDRLVKAHPAARVVSISGKDRGAVLLAGKDPTHAVFWYEKESGTFVTSPAYGTARAASEIATGFNETRAGGTLRGRLGPSWKRLPPPGKAVAPKELPPPVSPSVLESFQIPVVALGFDHDLGKPPGGYLEGIYWSPFVDELTADLALAFLSDRSFALGQGASPDLLCLSFSAHDTVAHNYGSESEETLDVLRRLDIQLGRLLDELEKGPLKGSVVLALSADHGFTPIPELQKKLVKGFAGGRLVQGKDALNPFLDRLNRLLSEELCLDPSTKPVFANEGWNLVYNRAAFPAKGIEGRCGPAGREVTAADLDAAVFRVVKRFWREEVEDVLLVSRRESWIEAPVLEFLENDFFATRSGDAVLIPRPNVLMHWDPGRGSGHGSQHEADTHVPLIFWGAGVPAGSSGEPATPYDLAPTLGRLLGVALPDATGKPLTLGK